MLIAMRIFGCALIALALTFFWRVIKPYEDQDREAHDQEIFVGTPIGELPNPANAVRIAWGVILVITGLVCIFPQYVQNTLRAILGVMGIIMAGWFTGMSFLPEPLQEMLVTKAGSEAQLLKLRVVGSIIAVAFIAIAFYWHG